MNAKIPYERVWAQGSRVKSVAALTHPTAVVIFSAATLVLGLLTSPGKSNLLTITLLTLAMAATQASIGVFNEVFDRDLDRRVKPWRGIPAGAISPRAAAWMGAGLLCLGTLLALAISPLIMVLQLCGGTAGILYSWRLKRTWLSWLPYVLAYPSLPVWVLVGLDQFVPGILWIYAIAAPFTAGIHLTNQMRDYDEDEAAGIKGLAQHLGKRRAARAAAWLLILGPIPGLVVVVSSQQPWFSILIASASILHWVLVLSVRWFPVERMTPATFRSLFRRLQLSAPLLLLAWYWVFLKGFQ